MKFVAPTLPPTSRDDDSRGVTSPYASADLPIVAPILGAQAIVVFGILASITLNVNAIAGLIQ